MTPLRLVLLCFTILALPTAVNARLGPPIHSDASTAYGGGLFAKAPESPLQKPMPDMRFGQPGGLNSLYVDPNKVVPALKAGIAAVEQGQFMRALSLLTPLAEQGVTRAQTVLGLIYYAGGPGVTKDYEAAARWLEPAAAQGRPEALHNLGILYKRGLGVQEDRVKALELFRHAAELGHGPAQFKLGLIRFTEGNTPKDAIDAVRWMLAAAKSGEVKALSFLGLFYGTGTGVKQDMVEAYKWLSLAATKGDTTALDPLSLLDKQISKAKKAEAVERANQWLAARQGH